MKWEPGGALFLRTQTIFGKVRYIWGTYEQLMERRAFKIGLSKWCHPINFEI